MPFSKMPIYTPQEMLRISESDLCKPPTFLVDILKLNQDLKASKPYLFRVKGRKNSSKVERKIKFQENDIAAEDRLSDNYSEGNDPSIDDDESTEIDATEMTARLQNSIHNHKSLNDHAVPPKLAIAYAASQAVKGDIPEVGNSPTGHGRPKSRRKSSNRNRQELLTPTNQPQNDSDGWISVVPKHHHRKSFNHEDAFHHRKKFNDSHKQGRHSFSIHSSSPKNGSGFGAKERKKSFVRELHQKGRAKSEAIKDKESFRALSKLNPEWANESAIVDSEADGSEVFSMDNASSASNQFEVWKSRMKGVPVLREEKPDPVPQLQPSATLSAISMADRYRRGSNHEDLIWGSTSSPQDAIAMHGRHFDDNQPQTSKFQDIFNPSSPKSNVSSATASPAAPISVPISYPQYSNNNGSTFVGSSSQLTNGQLYYSSPLGSMASFNVVSPQLHTNSEQLPYGQSPKFQSEYLKQITTFNTLP